MKNVDKYINFFKWYLYQKIYKKGVLNKKDTKIQLNGENGRYKSWEYLNNYFRSSVKGKTTKNVSNTQKDILALALYSYLESWGMFRVSLYDSKKLSNFTNDKIEKNKKIIWWINKLFWGFGFYCHKNIGYKNNFGCFWVYSCLWWKCKDRVKRMWSWNNFTKNTIDKAMKDLIEKLKNENFES